MPLLSTTVTSPAPPPLPPELEAVANWGGLALRWRGWDGSEWALHDLQSPVRLLAGARGLTMPAITRHTSVAAGIPGARYRGYRALQRELFWQLLVYSDTSAQEWIEVDRAFWRTMDPDRPGSLLVTQPSGETRTLQCAFSDDGAHAFDILPTTVGWAMYGVHLIADWPYWQGEPIVREWRAADPVPFFGPPGVIRISSGSTLGTATITNPGDVTGHVMWTTFGPFTSAQLGVRGKTIQVPFGVPDGQALRVDTRPDRLLATLHNVTDGTVSDHVVRDLTDSLGDAQWTGIPAGADVPLSLAVAGTGSVRAELIPLFHRAW